MKFIKLFEDYRNGLQDSEFNKIRYGQPTKEKQDISQVPVDKIRDWFIDNGIASKFIEEAPKNDSEITRNDLGILMAKMKDVSGEDLTFARYVENVENLAQSYIDLLASHGIEVGMDEWFGIDGQTEPFVFWLKNVINRPRPYQLAYYYEMPLYPLMHTDACSAAYPSGHATTAFVMSEYFSRKYPEHRAELEALGNRVADSREKMGIHYPSDTAISRIICELVWKNNLIDIR